MANRELPSRDNPLRTGRHLLYFLGPEIQVIEYDGDLTVDDIDLLIDVPGFSRECVVTIRDVRRLGKVGYRTRNRLAKVGYKGLGLDRSNVKVFVVGASIAQRGLIKMLLAAMGFVSGRQHTFVAYETLDEARPRSMSPRSPSIDL